ELLRDIRRAAIARLHEDRPEDKALRAAFDLLGALKSADDIEKLMEAMMAERGRLRRLSIVHKGIEGLCAAVDKALDVAAGTAADDLKSAFLDNLPEETLRMVAPRLGACTTSGNK